MDPASKNTIEKDFAKATEAFESMDFLKAIELSNQILQQQNNFAPAWSLLSEIALTQNNPEKASEFIKKAIMDDPDNPEYFIKLGHILQSSGQVQAAKHNYLKALQIDKHCLNALSSLGLLELGSNNLEQAYKYLKFYLEKSPNDPNVLNNISCICMLAGLTDEAEANLKHAIKINPNLPDAYNNLANIYMRQNKNEDALQFLKKAIEINPNFSDAYNTIGNLFKIQGDLQKAKLNYEKAIEIKPDFSEAHCNLGSIQISLRDIETAKKSLIRSLELKPLQQDALFLLGICFYQDEDLQKAADNFQKCLKINPKFLDVYYYLGKIEHFYNHIDKALTYYQKYLEQFPNEVEILFCVAKIYQHKNDIEFAIKYLEKILALEPNHLPTLSSYIYLKKSLCDWDNLPTLIETLEGQLKTIQDNIPLLDPNELLTFPFQDNLILNKLHIIKSNSLQENKKPFTHKRQKNNMIHIGYLSPYFNQHPIGLLTHHLFKAHDRTKFKISAYSLVEHSYDPCYQTTKHSVDHFIDLSTHTPKTAAQRIYEDRVDILIDLAGYAPTAMLETLAYQPAPIQCHWLGYPISTQASFVQFYISSLKTNTIEKNLFKEKIMQLPHVLVANQSFTKNLPKIDKKAIGLPQDKFIYASHVNTLLYTPELFRTWADILKETQESILWLSTENPIIRKNILFQFEKLGISQQKIVLTDKLTFHETWEHQAADLWLDTTISLHPLSIFLSLWVNVPMLTVYGPLPQNKIHAEILLDCGLSGLVCDSLEDYIQKAINFYNNPDTLIAVKEKINDAKSTWPLFDQNQFIVELEQLLTTAYNNYQENIYQDIIISNSSSTIPSFELLEQAIRAHTRHDLPSAKTLYQEVIALDFKNAIAHNNLGCLYYQQNELTIAQSYFEKAIQLNPSYPDPHNNLGNIFKNNFQYPYAEQAYLKAIQLNPQYADAYNNLGVTKQLRGNWQDARDYIQKAVRLDPKNVDFLCNLAHICLLDKQLKETEHYLEQALANFKHHIPSLVNLAHLKIEKKEYSSACLIIQDTKKLHTLINEQKILLLLLQNYAASQICAWEYIEENAEPLLKLLKDKPVHITSYSASPFYLQVSRLPIQIQTTYTLAYAKNLQQGKTPYSHQSTHFASQRKIKIGYISPDFNEHPISLLLHDAFKYHNRNDFEVFAFSYNHIQDQFTDTIRHSVDHWIPLGQRSPQEAAKIIYDLNIALLVDLSGYTKNSCLSILAYQPAPIQMHWLGYTGSLGAEFIQYVISDKVLISPEIKKHYNESMLYLPDSSFICANTDLKVQLNQRELFHIPHNKYIFCSFCKTYRLDKKTLSIWCEILSKTPESILWLYAENELMQNNIKQFFNNHDIDPQRIIFLKNTNMTNHWAVQHADLFLDTIEISGATNTFLSLIADTPVLTLNTSIATSKVASSILNGTHLESFITYDVKSYIKLAVHHYHQNIQLIKNGKERKKEKLLLKDNPCFSPKLFIQSLDDKYKQIYHHFITNQPPKDFK